MLDDEVPPTIQPIGLGPPDWTLPINRGLIVACVANTGGTLFDRVRGHSIPLVASSTNSAYASSTVNDGYGTGQDINSYYWSDTLPYAVTPFSVFMRMTPMAIGEAQGLFQVASVDADASPRFLIQNQAGPVRMFWNGAYRLATGSILVPGQQHTFGFAIGAASKAYIDGKSQTVTASTTFNVNNAARWYWNTGFPKVSRNQNYELYIWSRELNSDEFAALHRNPQMIWPSDYLEVFAPASAGSGSTTGVVSITEAGDTLSSTLTHPVTATLTQTEAGDTLSSAATHPVTAALAKTEAGDTLSSTATHPVTAALAKTEAGDTLSATLGNVDAVAFTKTEAGDTLSASATVLVKAQASISENGDTLAATATHKVTAALAKTEEGDTSSSTTSVLVKAQAAITEAADTLASTLDFGALALATAHLTEDGDTLSAAGTVKVTASASNTLADDTLAATAKVTVKASASITESDDTLSAVAHRVSIAAASLTEDADTLVAQANALIKLALAQTEDDDSVVATATLPVSGRVAITEDDDLCSSLMGAGVILSAPLIEDGDTLVGRIKIPPRAVEDADTIVFDLSFSTTVLDAYPETILVNR